MSELDGLLEAAWERYGRGELDSALGLARAAVESHPGNGRALFLLACVYERLGRLRDADRGFRRARSAPEEDQPAPFRTTWRHFTRAVELAADLLPTELQAQLAQVDIALANYPNSQISLAADNPEVLSWLSGPTAADAPAVGASRSRIHLFRRSHEHCTGSPNEFANEIRRSLNQELGHYLGFDAGDMERFGLL